MLLCACPHTPTCNNIEGWDKGALTPPQQQQKKAPNQKNKQPHNQNMGWEHSANTHPIKKEKTKLGQTKKKALSLRLLLQNI